MTKHKKMQDAMLVPQKANSSQEARQVRLSTNKILVIYVVLLILIVIAGLQKSVRIAFLFRDPLSVAGGAFYFGIFSNIGILIWCASAVICFFSFFILKQLNTQNSWQSFLLASGGLTSIILLDDFFLLHESAFPNYLGIPEKIVLRTYGIIAALYLIKFHKTIQKTNYKILVLALAFMAASVFIDVLTDIDILPALKLVLLENDRVFLLEDGIKLFGILTWLIYFTQIGLQRVMFAVSPKD